MNRMFLLTFRHFPGEVTEVGDGLECLVSRAEGHNLSAWWCDFQTDQRGDQSVYYKLSTDCVNDKPPERSAGNNLSQNGDKKKNTSGIFKFVKYTYGGVH